MMTWPWTKKRPLAPQQIDLQLLAIARAAFDQAEYARRAEAAAALAIYALANMMLLLIAWHFAKKLKCP